MESVFRVAIVYVALLIGLRVLGKREFGELEPFDLVVLLLIPELVQQGMSRDDASLTHSLVAVATLMLLVYVTSVLTYRFKKVEKILCAEPSVLVRHGSLVQRHLDRERVLPGEIFDAMHQAGLSRLGQVQWAILESDGKISIIPETPGRERQMPDEHSI